MDFDEIVRLFEIADDNEGASPISPETPPNLEGVPPTAPISEVNYNIHLVNRGNFTQDDEGNILYRQTHEEQINIPIDLIPIEAFKFIVDEEGYISNIMPEHFGKVRCEIVDKGCSFTSHPNAGEYGCINHAYGELPEETEEYIIRKSVLINEGTKGYIITSEKGKDYLIRFNGVRIIKINNKIIEPPPIKESIFIELKENLTKIINIFIEHYGEKFVSYPDIDNIKLKERGDSYIYILILFPEIVITNKLKESHIIRDLYVSFVVTYGWNEENFTISCSEKRAIRGTLSMDEYLAGYSFSHLSSGVEEWGTFCMGRGEMARIASELRYEVITENSSEETISQYLELLELYLFNFDSYLTWESVDTAPYKYISSVGVGNRLTSQHSNYITDKHTSLAKNLALNIFNNKSLRDALIDECFINIEDLFTLDIYKTSFFIDNLFTEDDGSNPIVTEVLRKVKYNPVTYSISSKIDLNNPLITSRISPDKTIKEGKSFEFKGKTIYQKIFDYVINQEKTEEFEIISPSFIGAFIIEIITLFTNIKYYGKRTFVFYEIPPAY